MFIWRWRDQTAIRQRDFKLVEPASLIPDAGLFNIRQNVNEIPENIYQDGEKEDNLRKTLSNWNAAMVNKL